MFALDRLRRGVQQHRRTAAFCALLAVALVLGLAAIATRVGSSPKSGPLTTKLQEASRIIEERGCELQFSTYMESIHPASVREYLPDRVDQAMSQLTLECRVSASGSQLTLEVVELLNRFPNVCFELQGTDVSDEVLGRLTIIAQLKAILLDNTSATDAGMTEFLTARPDVRIFLGSRNHPTRFVPSVSSVAELGPQSVR